MVKWWSFPSFWWVGISFRKSVYLLGHFVFFQNWVDKYKLMFQFPNSPWNHPNTSDFFSIYIYILFWRMKLGIFGNFFSTVNLIDFLIIGGGGESNSWYCCKFYFWQKKPHITQSCSCFGCLEFKWALLFALQDCQ